MSDSSADATYTKLAVALAAHNLDKASFLCRLGMARFPEDQRFARAMIEVALRLRRYGIASVHLQKAGFVDADLERRIEQGVASRLSEAAQRFLFIPEWHAGFWSAVNHVIGSLLLAEMTGRNPVVHWGDNSLFSRSDGVDAWTMYFEPVSSATPQDLTVPGLDCFPEPWSAEHFVSRRSEPVRTAAPAGTFGVSLLARTERVVVSDVALSINSLRPWIEPHHPMYGLSGAALNRHIVDKFIRLKPGLQRQVEELAAKTLTGRNCIAVHIRGTDKITETPSLLEINAQYIPWIDRFLADHADWAVFLITDSRPDWARMMQRYPGRIVTTNTLRNDGRRGVHMSGHDPVRVAVEVILDTYLAARCQAFLGNGSSNVSLAVEHLKDWPEGTYTLLGPDWRRAVFGA